MCKTQGTGFKHLPLAIEGLGRGAHHMRLLPGLLESLRQMRCHLQVSWSVASALGLADEAAGN